MPLLVTSHWRSMVHWMRQKTNCPEGFGKTKNSGQQPTIFLPKVETPSFISKVMETWLDLGIQRTTPLISYLK